MTLTKCLLQPWQCLSSTTAASVTEDRVYIGNKQNNFLLHAQNVPKHDTTKEHSSTVTAQPTTSDKKR